MFIRERQTYKEIHNRNYTNHVSSRVSRSHVPNCFSKITAVGEVRTFFSVGSMKRETTINDPPHRDIHTFLCMNAYGSDKIAKSAHLQFEHELFTVTERGKACNSGLRSTLHWTCLLYTSPSPRDLSTSRMPSSA